MKAKGMLRQKVVLYARVETGQGGDGDEPVTVIIGQGLKARVPGTHGSIIKLKPRPFSLVRSGVVEAVGSSGSDNHFLEVPDAMKPDQPHANGSSHGSSDGSSDEPSSKEHGNGISEGIWASTINAWYASNGGAWHNYRTVVASTAMHASMRTNAQKCVDGLHCIWEFAVNPHCDTHLSIPLLGLVVHALNCSNARIRLLAVDTALALCNEVRERPGVVSPAIHLANRQKLVAKGILHTATRMHRHKQGTSELFETLIRRQLQLFHVFAVDLTCRLKYDYVAVIRAVVELLQRAKHFLARALLKPIKAGDIGDRVHTHNNADVHKFALHTLAALVTTTTNRVLLEVASDVIPHLMEGLTRARPDNGAAICCLAAYARLPRGPILLAGITVSAMFVPVSSSQPLQAAHLLIIGALHELCRSVRFYVVLYCSTLPHLHMCISAACV